MISLLRSEPQAPPTPPPKEPLASQIEPESGEFEIVMGRRQVAGVSLVVMVTLAVFSGVSYMVGKSSEPKASVAAASAPITPVPATPVIQPVAPPVLADMPAADAGAPGGPLFADPIPGAVYIQVGAVEKGMAEIWVEGLRTHGLKAFVAPGLSDRIFRVLVGPLPNPDAYRDAKDVMDRIGLASFGRRYQL